MNKFKIHNEYRDKLCDPLISEYLKTLGCDIFSPECWIVDEKIKEQQIDHVIDSWTGLIGEGYVFHSYRYTLSFIQTWLRDNYNVHIFIGWKPDVKKWDSYAYSLDLSLIEYINQRDLNKFKNDNLFDTYEEALESGIKFALQEEIKKIYC